jgi:hypothetical protein
MSEDNLDHEHGLLWKKLEEIAAGVVRADDNRARVMMFVIPMMITGIMSVLGLSWEINNRLASHLEAGGKLGARLEQQNIATKEDLKDKYERHLYKHDGLNHDIEKLEDGVRQHERRHYLYPLGEATELNPTRFYDEELLPDKTLPGEIPILKRRIPAIYHPKEERQ